MSIDDSSPDRPTGLLELAIAAEQSVRRYRDSGGDIGTLFVAFVVAVVARDADVGKDCLIALNRAIDDGDRGHARR